MSIKFKVNQFSRTMYDVRIVDKMLELDPFCCQNKNPNDQRETKDVFVQLFLAHFTDEIYESGERPALFCNDPDEEWSREQWRDS